MKSTFSQIQRNTAALVASWCLASAYSIDASEYLGVYSPNGTHLATAVEHGRIHYCNSSDYAVQGTFYICHPRAISFSANGKLLAAASERNGSQAKIKVWCLADHQQLCEIISPGGTVNAIAVSADGQFVAVATSEGRIDMWRVAGGQTQWSRPLSIPAKSIHFSLDSRRLDVRADNGDKRQFEAGNGRPVQDLEHR